MCATPLQTNELVKTQAYQQGNTKEALVQVFLRMDEMLSQESVQGELEALAGPRNHADEEEECVYAGCLMAADFCCVCRCPVTCVSFGDCPVKGNKCHWVSQLLPIYLCPRYSQIAYIKAASVPP